MLKGLRLEEIGQLLESFGLKVPQTGEGFEDMLLSLMKEMELHPDAEEGSAAEDVDVNKKSQKSIQQLVSLIGVLRTEGEILSAVDPYQDSVKIQENTNEPIRIAQSSVFKQGDISFVEETPKISLDKNAEDRSPVVNNREDVFSESLPPQDIGKDTINAGVRENKGILAQSWKADTPELSKNGNDVLPPDIQNTASKVDVSADSAKMSNGDPLKELKREETTSALNTKVKGKVENKKGTVIPESNGSEKKSHGLESEVAIKAQKNLVKESPNSARSHVNISDTAQKSFAEDIKTIQSKPVDGLIRAEKDRKPDTRIDKTPLTPDNTTVDEPKPEEALDTPQRVKEAFPKYADKEIPLTTKHRDLEAGKSQKESVKPEFAPQVRDREAWLQSPESEGEIQTLRTERREIPTQPQRQDVKQINLRIEDAFLRFRFQSEALSVDIRIKEMIERNLSYLDVQRLSKSLQSLGLSLEGLKINGTELYPRGSKFGRREERRFNIEEDAVSDKKAPDSSADSPGLNLLL